MSRPTRVEVPDAYYHVMNHGRAWQNIFHTASDFEQFLASVRGQTTFKNLNVGFGQSMRDFSIRQVDSAWLRLFPKEVTMFWSWQKLIDFGELRVYSFYSRF